MGISVIFLSLFSIGGLIKLTNQKASNVLKPLTSLT